MLIFIVTVGLLSLAGCKEEDTYSDFHCFDNPLDEDFSSVGLPSMYETVQISISEKSASSPDSNTWFLELENTSEIMIWFPPKLNLIIWRETSENNWQGIQNLLSNEIHNSMVLGPSGSDNSSVVIPVKFNVAERNLPSNMAITLWGFRTVDNAYCEDHHGGVFRFSLEPGFKIVELEEN